MKGYKMDQLSFRSRKMLLEAVHSAEDAAIQLRQYAAEGWLRMELPCVMPRREDNDRSRLLAGLLRNAIHRAFPKHDQPRFYTCVLAV